MLRLVLLLLRLRVLLYQVLQQRGTHQAAICPQQLHLQRRQQQQKRRPHVQQHREQQLLPCGQQQQWQQLRTQ